MDAAPVGRFLRTPPTQPVFDTGRYRAAVDAAAQDRRPSASLTAADARCIATARRLASDLRR
ncbi:hypothetical protein OHB39_24930 [Streptomyces sp. NBC_00047]|uniref:hypothetical protein n=1 Tax=Streptomyces sp. NBC_00047 TaxID=2975627 RepID=UPI00224D2BE7|nr:hypothetical protein [Streptomyces sp. NBC_00047]MCX5610787.1 hypothetical protein [Streptomyces sp. NBC_00047]